MINLKQWRSTIGCFNHLRRICKKQNSAESPCCVGSFLSAILAFSCVVLLLLSGDLEVNPGPGSQRTQGLWEERQMVEAVKAVKAEMPVFAASK